MDEAAHRLIAYVWFSCLKVLHKSVRFFFGQRTLEKPRAQTIHKFARLIAQLRWRELAHVDRVSSDLPGQLRRTNKSQIAAWPSLRRARRRNRVAVDQIIREVITKQQSRCADPGLASVPAFHVGRRKKKLSHLSHGILGDAWRRQGRVEQLHRLDDVLPRAFDLRAQRAL